MAKAKTTHTPDHKAAANSSTRSAKLQQAAQAVTRTTRSMNKEQSANTSSNAINNKTGKKAALAIEDSDSDSESVLSKPTRSRAKNSCREDSIANDVPGTEDVTAKAKKSKSGRETVLRKEPPASTAVQPVVPHSSGREVDLEREIAELRGLLVEIIVHIDAALTILLQRLFGT
jgi:hypothetical protein